MSNLTVVPATTRRQKSQFLEFPWQVYRENPHWIPPIRAEQKELVGYKHHPFYENNRVQTFLACRGKQVCGRIAAILNQTHNEFQKEHRGFFGFFECVDDQEVATALFDAAGAWLAEQGVHRVRGPANPGINYAWGTLIEGFDSRPGFMMPYNPPYYPRLIEAYGFRKAQDLYAYRADISMLPVSDGKHEPLAQQIIERFDIRLRSLDRSRFREDVEAFLSIYNRSMTKHWGFSPLSDAELHHLAKGLRYLVIPELAVGAEIDGRLVGVALALPDYGPRIKQIDGRLFPFGFLRLLFGRRKIKNVRLLAANVLPEYQLMGVSLVLLRAMVPPGLAWGLEEVEYSWVAESNSLSRGGLEKSGAIRSKTYRVYDLDPPETPQDASRRGG